MPGRPLSPSPTTNPQPRVLRVGYLFCLLSTPPSTPCVIMFTLALLRLINQRYMWKYRPAAGLLTARCTPGCKGLLIATCGPLALGLESPRPLAASSVPLLRNFECRCQLAVASPLKFAGLSKDVFSGRPRFSILIYYKVAVFCSDNIYTSVATLVVAGFDEIIPAPQRCLTFETHGCRGFAAVALRSRLCVTSAARSIGELCTCHSIS